MLTLENTEAMTSIPLKPKPSIDFASHRAVMVRWISSKVPHPSDAEDIVQRALLRAHQNQHQLEKPSAAKAWLRSIVLREYASWQRTYYNRSIREPLAPEMSDPSSQSLPEEQVAQKELQLHIQEAIQSLPPHERVVVEAFYLQDLSYAEIAEQHNTTPSAIASRLHKARLRLRDKLNRLLHGFTYSGAAQKTALGLLLSEAIAFLLIMLAVMFPFVLVKGASLGLQRPPQTDRRYAWIVVASLVGIGFFSWKLSLGFLMLLSGVLGVVESIALSLESKQPPQRKAARWLFGLSGSLLTIAFLSRYSGPISLYTVAWVVYLMTMVFAAMFAARGLSAFFVWLAEQRNEASRQAGILFGLSAACGAITSTLYVGVLGPKVAFVVAHLPFVILMMAGLYIVLESLFNAVWLMYAKVARVPALYLIQALVGAAIIMASLYLNTGTIV